MSHIREGVLKRYGLTLETVKMIKGEINDYNKLLEEGIHLAMHSLCGEALMEGGEVDGVDDPATLGTVTNMHMHYLRQTVHPT